MMYRKVWGWIELAALSIRSPLSVYFLLWVEKVASHSSRSAQKETLSYIIKPDLKVVSDEPFWGHLLTPRSSQCVQRK